jgi:hypothetical protein
MHALETTEGSSVAVVRRKFALVRAAYDDVMIVSIDLLPC